MQRERIPSKIFGTSDAARCMVQELRCESGKKGGSVKNEHYLSEMRTESSGNHGFYDRFHISWWRYGRILQSHSRAIAQAMGPQYGLWCDPLVVPGSQI